MIICKSRRELFYDELTPSYTKGNSMDERKKRLLREYASSSDAISVRSESDLSPLEEWLLDRAASAELSEILNQHRTKATVMCDKDCWCLDIGAALCVQERCIFQQITQKESME